MTVYPSHKFTLQPIFRAKAEISRWAECCKAGFASIHDFYFYSIEKNSFTKTILLKPLKINIENYNNYMIICKLNSAFKLIIQVHFW